MPKPRKIRAKLMEVGKDFEVKVRSYSHDPKRRTVRRMELVRKDVRISIKKLKENVAALQERYPDKGFRLEKVLVLHDSRWRAFWRLDRKQKGVNTVPVYYSSTLKRLFVPTRYPTRRLRFTCSVLLYRLRDFGASYRLGYL